MEIPLPQSNTDIYAQGFDKNLNRNETTKEINPTVYDPLTGAVNPTLIQSGSITGILNVADGSIKSDNFVKGSAGWEIASNGDVEFNAGHFRGTLSAGAIDIPDTITVHSFHVDQNGNNWWGATDLASGTAKVLNTGEASFKSINITGGTVVTTILSGEVAQGNLNVANRGWSQTCVFSSGSPVYVSWATGSFITSTGIAYNIGTGSTGIMGARHYVFLDTGVATNVYQTTSVAANAVGAGRVLIATTINTTTEAEFYVFGGSGGENILGENIIANSITGGEIAANTITASKIGVGYLSAIAADMGTLTAGNITMGTSGYIMGGQTDYNIGTGFFLGYSTNKYKFSIGNPSGDWVIWDGSNLTSNKWTTIPSSASDTLVWSDDAAKDTPASDLTKVKEIKCNQVMAGARIKFDLTAINRICYGRIYKNAVAIGIQRTTALASETFSEDLTGFNKDDLIQIYGYYTGAGAGASTVANFRIYYDEILFVNQDP